MPFIKVPHDQQIFFENKTTRWIRNVVHIEQGNWFHLMTEEGVEYITNPDKILFVRVYGKEKKKKKSKDKTD